LLLAASLGLPYLALSATGPLLQAWFSRLSRGGGVLPYRLYALSNVGSLLALVTYPFIVEPHLSRRTQAMVWSGGWIFFAVLCAYCTVRAARLDAAQVPVARDADGAPGSEPTWLRRALWLLLPACASVLLLAATNKLCQDVAVVPFLWVLPLGLYLLSFIICFDSHTWYVRPLYAGALAALLPVLCWIMFQSFPKYGVVSEIAVYAAVMFLACMLCHGELYRLRPCSARHLTGYYLTISAGGAIGGIFVALIAPIIFREYFEFQVGLVACWLLLMIVWWTEQGGRLAWGRPAAAWVALIATFLLFGHTMYAQAQFVLNSKQTRWRMRNFYGVLSVQEVPRDQSSPHCLQLRHGRIVHGAQFLDPPQQHEPASYYGPRSGVAMVLRALTQRQRPGGTRIGVIGLGAGTIAAFAQPGDSVRFYEINPAVEQLARRQFTFLSDCRGKSDVIIGDGRLALEAEPDAQRFDVLILDAFSSDSVPMHLLTRECFDTYLRHLAPDGIIVANMSNRVIDLQPVLARMAEALHLEAFVIADRVGDLPDGFYPTIWFVMPRDRFTLFDSRSLSEVIRPAETRAGIGLWTDEHNNLFQILR
jgi:hypothetical protein